MSLIEAFDYSENNNSMISAELYPMLVLYARKNKSPNITINNFLNFLGKTAKHYSAESPAWNKWLGDREEKFWSEMSPLIEAGKCEFVSDTNDGQIFLRNYYPELISNVYINTDTEADIPFPSEEYLGIVLPGNQEKHEASDAEFLSALEDTGKSDNCIVKVNFSSGFGSALFLRNMLIGQLGEMAVAKVRNYLKRHGNLEYSIHKLAAPLQGKEIYIKRQMESINLSPANVYSDIEEGGELSYVFWNHFCALIKNEVKKKLERLPVDVGAFQAACLIEVINGHYRSKVVKQREVELAFKALESYLAKPPFLHSMATILKLTDSKGKPLLGQYSGQELEKWLIKQTTEAEGDELPPLYLFRSSSGNKEEHFMLKERVPAHCGRLLAEARLLIKETIQKRWSKLFFEYKSEPAMESDIEFEKELYKTGIKSSPDLMNLLADLKLFLIYQEAEKNPGGIPSSANIFYNGALIPYSSLFQINRKDILHEAKIDLPFWHSVPFLLAIVKFFNNISKKEKKAKSPVSKEKDGDGSAEENIKSKEIKTAAAELQSSLLPAGYTTDRYLEELEDRWIQLIDRKARENLIHDVKSLARDNLRLIIKLNKQFKPTKSNISDIALELINRNTTLNSLSDKESLRSYLVLYMVKLLAR